MKSDSSVARLERVETAPRYGHVVRIGAGVIKATGPMAALGELCHVECQPLDVTAQVVAVDADTVTLVPLDTEGEVRMDARVTARSTGALIGAGDAFAGRAVDALGKPLDGGAPVHPTIFSLVDGTVAAPTERVNPDEVLPTGIRSIDGLLTLGVGQRVGIFAASGVGKTSLVEQLAIQIGGDRCILCLVGERGREVSGLWQMVSQRADAARYTMVASTSDQSPILRVRAVGQALALAEHWRSRGEHVVLLLDSVTRLAMALREIGLAAGAPPTVRAYTPNVFSALPRLVERCGSLRGGGAITAIMTVLSETDDVDDPVAELMKSLLDGHIILSRELAEQGHFPAIDIGRSISRQAVRLVSAKHARTMVEAAGLLATYNQNRIMIETGVYRPRSNERIDRAIARREPLNQFLRQRSDEQCMFKDAVAALEAALAVQ